ncbi:hypothetical protein D3C84_1167910 [compost metagenome]
MKLYTIGTIKSVNKYTEITLIEVTKPNSKSKSFPVIINVAKPIAVVKFVIKVETPILEIIRCKAFA